MNICSTQAPRRTRALRAAARLLLGGLVLVSACGGRAGDEERPNLVLITVDTLRADHLTPYGHERDTSPFLARLAEESFLFENAVSQCGTTPQSLSSLMTGLYPYADGIVTQNGRFVYLVRGNATLAGLLSAQGYQTHAISSSIQACAATGLDLGFETFDGATFDLETERKRQLRAGELTDRAIEWLRGRDDERPFFLWLHYIDPHSPYRPPAEYAELWSDEERPEDDGPLRHYRFDGQNNEQFPLRDGELTNLILDYDREIRYVDDQLARLFREALDEHLESSLVLFSSDHGEGLGQHGLIDHNDIFEGVLRVPLLLRLPGRTPAAGRVDTGVMLVDVLPTVLDLVDVGLPGPVRGTSLRPLLEGGELADRQRLRLGEYPDHRAVYFRSFKLIERTFDDGTRLWLYDIDRDFEEERDLGRRKQGLLERLLARKQKELYDRSLGAADGGGPLPEVTDEMLEELTKLGY